MYIFLGRAFKRTMRLSNSLKVKNLCRKRGGGHKTPIGKLAFVSKWNSGGGRNFKSEMHLMMHKHSQINESRGIMLVKN